MPELADFRVALCGRRCAVGAVAFVAVSVAALVPTLAEALTPARAGPTAKQLLGDERPLDGRRQMVDGLGQEYGVVL